MKNARRWLIGVTLITAVVATAAAVLATLWAGASRSSLATLPTTRFADPDRDGLWITAGRGPLVGIGSTGERAEGQWYAVAATAHVSVGDLALGTPLGGAAVPENDAVTASPVPGDGVLYLPTRAAGVVAVDLLTRKAAWQTRVAEWTTGLALAGRRLIVGATHGVYALDADHGRLLWSHAADAQVTTGVTVAAGRVCFGTAAGDVRILDLKTGRPTGRVSLDQMPAGDLCADGPIVFVCAAAQRDARELPLYAIDAPAARLKWRHTPAQLPVMLGTERTRGPRAAGGLVCFSFGEHLYAVDAEGGSARWTYTARPDGVADWEWRRTVVDVPFVGAATFRGDVVFVNVVDRLAALSARTGREVWRYVAPIGESPGRRTGLPPLVLGNTVVGAIGESTVHAARLGPRRSAPPVLNGVARGLSRRGATGAAIAALLLLALATWRRRPRALAAAMCAALICATVAAWGTSYAGGGFVGRKSVAQAGAFRAVGALGVAWRDGAVTFGASHVVADPAARPTDLLPPDPAAVACCTWTPNRPEWADLRDPPPNLGLLDFRATTRSRPSGVPGLGDQSEHSVTLPCWAVAALLSLPPFAWLTGAWRDRRRFGQGRCANCGYDLRASAGPCPECGTPPPASAGARNELESSILSAEEGASE